MLWAPFYAIGDLVARTTGAPVDGFSRPYIAAVAYGSALYGFLAVALAILAARRLDLDAFGAGLALWLGTPLLFYMYIAPPFSHACSAFTVALFIWVWLRVRERWSPRGLIALGAAGALMAMVREQDAFFVIGPALDYAWTVWQGARREARGAAPEGGWIGMMAAAIAFIAVFTPQVATYLVLNGHIGPHASVARKMNWVAPHALQVLFSPEHGFFIWTPLALIALAGLAFLPAEATLAASPLGVKKQAALCLAAMVLLQIYVGGSVESWTVAGAFGQRRFIALTAVMVIGYAALAAAARRRSPRAHTALVAVTVLCVYWNLALTAEFAIGLMDRQKLEPRKNAYDAFVTLPAQAPSLLYRYLFDRGSFYQRRP